MSESEARQTAATWRPDSTGLPQLDEVLGGGIPRGSLTLIVGQPGSGKTTLAAQMAFAAAQTNRQVLILTALSEPAGKMLAHLQTYSFFNPELIGDSIEIISLLHYFEQGLSAAAEMIRSDVRRKHVSLLVLDGFSGVRDAADDRKAARSFLYDIGTTLGVLGCTTVVTSEGTPREPSSFPEMTTADVTVGMHYALRGVREYRALEAIKVRGAASLPGLHGLDLTEDGVQVYPRLEARVARDARAARRNRAQPDTSSRKPAGRAAFNLPALDAVFGSGLTERTSTLVLGSPGVGKTLLGLQWTLAGTLAGQPAVFLSFHETQDELQQKVDTFIFGPALERALAPGGGLVLLRQPSVECDADMLAEELLAAIDQSGARRVVIDSLAEIERSITETSGADRVAGFFAALLEALRLREVTTLVIRESGVVSGNLVHPAGMVSLLAANVLWLQQVTYQGRLHRVLSVPKMRFSAHDVTLREFVIRAPGGLHVLAPEESSAGLVAGISHQEGLVEQE